MLQPARRKYRKEQKGRNTGVATRGNSVAFGDFGLKCTDRGRLTARQIEAARRAISRHVKRGGRIWIRVFPDKPISKKPLETRMGTGKGAVEAAVDALLAEGHAPALLEALGVFGCEAARHLGGLRADGCAAACSFFSLPTASTPLTLSRAPADPRPLAAAWDDDAELLRFRAYHAAPPEPCRSCHYLSLCRGGCRVVSAHASGDARAPDPECPRVLDYRAALADRDQVNNGLAKSAPPAAPGSPAAVSSTALAEGELHLMTQRAKRHLKVLG